MFMEQFNAVRVERKTEIAAKLRAFDAKKRASKARDRAPEEARLKVVRRWQKAVRMVIRQRRANKIATAQNEAETARRRAVREQANAAAANKTERPFSAAGPSHKEGAPHWAKAVDPAAAARAVADKAARLEKVHAKAVADRKREQENQARLAAREAALETSRAINQGR
jgi:hypothetical protein